MRRAQRKKSLDFTVRAPGPTSSLRKETVNTQRLNIVALLTPAATRTRRDADIACSSHPYTKLLTIKPICPSSGENQCDSSTVQLVITWTEQGFDSYNRLLTQTVIQSKKVH